MAEEKERVFVESGDVQTGLRMVGAEVALGRSGLYLGRGPDGGFAIVAGVPGRGHAEVGHGHMVAVQMTADGLSKFVERACALLTGQDQGAPPGVIVQ